MQSSQILDSLKCTSPPSRFWRVNHGGSQAHHDNNGDLVANSTSTPSTLQELKQAVDDHLDWRNPQPSCFLSVFSDRQHARNWASQRGGREWQVSIYEIDTVRLQDVYIFKLEQLILPLEISPSRDYAHEYLILHRIPNRAVTSRLELGELKEMSKLTTIREIGC
jgi:hypothetical protein